MVDWKTPVLARRSTKRKQLVNSDDDDEGAGAERDEDLALAKLSWRSPTLVKRVESVAATSTAKEAGSTSQSSSSFLTQTPACSSSSLPVDDEATFELESVLLEEEEYGIPAYNRHRTETGLRPLDDRLSEESHQFIEEEEGERGMACGSVLEIMGTPNSGKTSLLIQLAVSERLSGIVRARQRAESKGEQPGWVEVGSVSHQVMLIDTEGSVGLDRIVSTAEEQISRLELALSSHDKAALLQSVLAGIHYCRCIADYELLALVIALVPALRRPTSQNDGWTRSEEEIKTSAIPASLPPRTSLILIDTIGYLFRASLPDEAPSLRNQRRQVFDELGRFSERCRRKGIKLVCSNQMAMTIIGKEGLTTNLYDKDGEEKLVPVLRNHNASILGPDAWRLVLFRAGNQGAGVCNRFASFLSQPASMGRPSEGEMSPWLPLVVHAGGIDVL